MKVLIIGGSTFVGPHIVDALRRRGHSVTLFNRGRSALLPPPGVEFIAGDRERDLGLLEGRQFDAVIDTCGFVPRIVRLSAEMAARCASHYTFISTISVYADPLGGTRGEDEPLATIADPSHEAVTNDSYGPLKALCEAEVKRAMDGRALVIRPGLIVGPLDPTDRFTYWPHRFALGGDVLVPGEQEHHTSFIDARDLAAFIATSVESGLTGTYNASGDPAAITMGGLVDACVSAAGSDANPVWVDASFLAAHNVTPWGELPVWLPAGDDSLMWASSAKAAAHGLAYRPMSETVRDTLEWSRGLGIDRPLKAGLTRDRESALLAQWAARS